jgi:L-rhamnose mutarotase
MQQVGFLIQVKAGGLEEYKRIHEQVWPELLEELKAAGMRNYSLWLRPDGLEFGYLECDDWDAACKYLESSEVHSRWQAWMQEYLDTPQGAEDGQPIQMLQQVFYLA